MIYAAELDLDDVVVRVLVAPSVAWCVETLGGTWVETYPDGSMRGKFAGPGDTYDSDADEFVSPAPVDPI
jgi:hypothetical protein